MITEKTRNYETLIRHTEDGKVAAHHLTITEIVKDGVVLSAQISEPRPISDFASELGPIIGDAFIALEKDRRELIAERDSLKAEIAELIAINSQGGEK